MRLANSNYWSFLAQLCVVLLIQRFPFAKCNQFCSGNQAGIDGKLLGAYSWIVPQPSTRGVELFYLSLCEPMEFKDGPEKACNGATACKVSNRDGKKEVLIYGRYNASAEYSSNKNYIFLHGDACKVGGQSRETKLAIGFQCGSHLGSPVYMMTVFCQTLMRWRTSAACHPETPTKRLQVPCYVVDETTGIKYDLSHLTKNRGAHKVDVIQGKFDLYINVCQDINDDLIGCAKETAACQNLGGRTWKPVGKINRGTKVEIVAGTGDLTLTYPADQWQSIIPFSNCTTKPNTVIHFRCPSKRGRNRPPRLLENLSCQYVIEWETDHACPEHAVLGDVEACTIKVEGQHLDLKRLRSPRGYYQMNATFENQSVEIVLDICGPGVRDTFCGQSPGQLQTTNVCFKDPRTGKFVSLGSKSEALLRYTDGRAVLVYPDGSLCRAEAGSNRKWSSVVEFVCDSDAMFGHPVLSRVDEELCVYEFEWRTVSACVAEVIVEDDDSDYNDFVESCTHTEGNYSIDLSTLSLDTGSWYVMDEHKGFNYSLYLDVCSAVKRLGVQAICPSDSAVCGISEDNKSAVKFGRYSTVTLKKEADKPVASLEFTGGDECKSSPGKKYKTVVHLTCVPGVHGASPRFFAYDDKECVLHLEWHTSVACPQISLNGNSCVVEDKVQGFRIDLMALAEYGVQTIEHKDFEYDISVCRPLPDTYKCSVDGAGVCRHNLIDKRNATSLGMASSDLAYHGGMATLMYQKNSSNSQESYIVFLCDFDAGVGKPYVFDSHPDNTVFNWPTSFACPSMNAHYQSCVVHRKNGIYDLSRLSRARPNTDWEVEPDLTVGGDVVKQKIYVALCRPLIKPPRGCNPLASVCVKSTYKNGTVTVADAGHAVASPKFIGDQLTLEYGNGERCMRFGVNDTYKTIVHFMCDEKNIGESLQYLGKLGSCTHSLLWVTNAACALRRQPLEECTLVDSSSGDVFDISHMRSPTFYRAGDYEFNLCGPVVNSSYCKGDNVSVCLVKNGKGTPLALSNGYSLQSLGGDTLELSYFDGNDTQGSVRVDIELICTSPSSAPDQLKRDFIEAVEYTADSRVHRINFYSSSVCPLQRHEVTSCSIFNSDNGNTFDLRPLARSSYSNWEVIGYSGSPFEHDFMSKSSSNQKYHFNICKKLNSVSGYKCPRGSLACVTSDNQTDQMGQSLGRHLDSILFADDGTIAIKYVSGDMCPNSNTTAGVTVPMFKTTLIALSCAPKETDIPRLVTNSHDCDYVFYMETPAACPVKSNIGDDCKVTEPNFGYVFDLSQLAKINGTQAVYSVINPDDKGIHKLAVCGKLPDAATECGDEDAASCLFGKDGKNLTLGKNSSKLHYNTGILTLTYNDGMPGCSDHSNRTTTIHFICDHSAAPGTTSPLFDAEDDNCGYIFNWYTVLACPPYTEQNCRVETLDGIVDLTKLSNPRDNYIAASTDPESTSKYVINVCRSVVHQKALTCEFSSGACIVGSTNTINIGRVASGPVFEDGAVHLRYTDGDLCTSGSSPGQKISTHIEFRCDEDDSGPVHLIEEHCVNQFIWSTPHACPLHPEVIPSRNKSCTAIHPATHSPIDLRSLVRADTESPYSIPGPNGGTFQLNICGEARDTSCSVDTGICFEPKNGHALRVGAPSSKLVWDDGVLTLVFEGGDHCGTITEKINTESIKKMSAVIHFVCPSAGFSQEAPRFVSQSPDDCVHRFIWATELACHNMLQCALYEEFDLIDLSPLSTRGHLVKNIIDPDHSYYLSVCKPLDPKRPYTNMPPNAAAVRVSSNGKVVESLGHAFLEPFTDFQHTVSLLYINGSKCEHDDKELNKARIIFECDYSQDAGEPVLIDVNKVECVYTFRWRTNMVCSGSADTHFINPRANCTFDVPQRGISLDLSPLSMRSPYQVRLDGPDGKPAGNFNLSLCKEASRRSPACKSAELCFVGNEGTTSFGRAESYHYQGSSLFVKYSGGDKCISSFGGKTHSALIEFECDPLHGDGRPVVLVHYACITSFKWKTSLVCSKQLLLETDDCTVSNGAQKYDLSLLSSVSHVWSIEEPRTKNTYFLNVCGSGWSWPLEALDKCHQSGACMEKKDGTSVGREFASIGSYVSRKAEIISNGHLRITYSGGDPHNCNNPSQYPTTVIDLMCVLDGDTVGTPRLVQEPTSTNCTYVFSWLSRSACQDPNDELIEEKDGLLIDPTINRAFNISLLLHSTFRASEVRNENDNYTYLINLSPPTQDKRVLWRMGHCSQSAVCQVKKVHFMKNLGSFSSRKFVLRGRELILEIGTGSKCVEMPSETVRSIISFSCQEGSGIGQPVFIYESRACHYVFSWPTEYVCHDHFVSHSQLAARNESSGSTTGLVLVLTGLVSLAAVAIIFLSKPQNRMAVRARTLRFFRTVTMPHYYYSKTESEMQSPLDNDGDTVLLSPSLVLQPDDDDFSPLA